METSDEAVQLGDVVTRLESPSGYRVAFHFLHNAGQTTILGERCPEVMVATNRGGYGASDKAHAERIIARLGRRGWH